MRTLYGAAQRGNADKRDRKQTWEKRRINGWRNVHRNRATKMGYCQECGDSKGEKSVFWKLGIVPSNNRVAFLRYVQAKEIRKRQDRKGDFAPQRQGWQGTQ